MTSPRSSVPPEVEAAAVDDLRARLLRLRAVTDPWEGDAARGFGYDRLAGILEHWASAYDWRGAERRIRALPWETIGVGDGALRVVHRGTASPDAPTVVLLHGWPDSVLRFERLLPLLADLDVVVPALPGFPFALRTERPVGPGEMAEQLGAALDDLGCRRVVLSGGDVGGFVAEALAGSRPELVAALHLTSVSPRHVATVDRGVLDAEATAYLDRAAAWSRAEGGYVAEQSTRPRTLMVGLGDSPAGLAAWLLEKIVGWSDGQGRAFDLDDLITWVCAYWFTGSIGTSFATYSQLPPTARTAVPTVFSAFAADINPPPRSFVEQVVDLREFRPHAAGGHFGAWEQPEEYAADLRLAVGLAGR